MKRSLIITTFLACVGFMPAQAQEDTFLKHDPVQVVIKNNLLGFPMLEPNIALELGFGGRYSAYYEGYRPRIHNFGKNKIWLEANVWNVGARYWLRDWNKSGKHSMTGHFLGAYYMEGNVDIQSKNKGFQAPVQTFGVEYGYVIHLDRKLRLELSAGIGYLTADYDRYHVSADGETLNYRYSGKTHWFGPTKGSISLVLLLNKIKK